MAVNEPMTDAKEPSMVRLDTMPKAAAWPLLFVLAGLLPATAQPQNAASGGGDCELSEAIKDYELGRLPRVAALLERCLGDGFRREQREEGYALLAKTYVALDEFEKADAAISQLLRLNPSFSPASTDPPIFAARVDAAGQGTATVVVTSVSKSPESLREAPATVAVITAEQIARRGYLDLEALLHDLPGFDVTRGRGDIYSNMFQRGYRSANDRTLFLVDGIEENDLWQNVAHLSRQYPLSNVDRVEVIYGPASTMYGPNAFAGVVNVITKEPEDYLAEGRMLAVHALVGGGTWSTGYVDATVAGRTRGDALSYSVTARLYRSDEMDLSGFKEWDFDPAFYDGVDYCAALFPKTMENPNPDCDQTLAEQARASDKAALAAVVEGQPVGYSDLTDDWAVYGKIKVSSFTFGFQAWQRKEGLGSWYTDDFYAGADNGGLWIPEQTFFYVKYARDFGPKLGLSVLTSFKRHGLDGGTREQQLRNYASGRRLDADDLAAGVDSFWRRTFFDQSSQQFKTEATVTYQKSPRFNLVTGFEFRTSNIQGDFLLTTDCPDKEDGECPAGENRTDTRGQFFDHLDAGVFAQASLKPRENWKIVLGARLDYNDISEAGGTFGVELPDGTFEPISPEGYGMVFNPRLAVIYTQPRYVLKAIYAEAFKDASAFSRYATSPGFRDLPNPSLEPERVSNLELAAGWQPSEELFVDLAVYRAEYDNAVGLGRGELPNGDPTFQNQAVGSLEVTGLQANLEWKRGDYELAANYTYTDPTSTDGGDEARIADIAEHSVNVIANAHFHRDWNVNLRLNYVGERQTGPGTTAPNNPDGPVPSYFVAGAALAYEGRHLHGSKLQLLVNNLFDEAYSHPGIGDAGGRVLASRLPQNERSIFLRLIYNF